jgi:hypothetical protein
LSVTSGTPPISTPVTALGHIRSHLTSGASGDVPIPNGTSRRPSRPQRGQRRGDSYHCRALHRFAFTSHKFQFASCPPKPHKGTSGVVYRDEPMTNAKNGNDLAELERRLWAAADQLWANSSLRPSEYSAPVLGLIFLRFADNAFTKVEAELKGKATDRRAVGKLD